MAGVDCFVDCTLAVVHIVALVQLVPLGLLGYTRLFAGRERLKHLVLVFGQQLVGKLLVVARLLAVERWHKLAVAEQRHGARQIRQLWLVELLRLGQHSHGMKPCQRVDHFGRCGGLPRRGGGR